MEKSSIKRVGIVYFSPTNTTKKICLAIAKGMGASVPVDLNITYPDFRERLTSGPDRYIGKLDHLIFGAPVYTGKLPLQVIECLQNIHGSGKPCTAVVLYGNRDYGIALRHMVKMLSDNGFKVIGAAAFIGQHSYSDLIPVAVGRPDQNDLKIAHELGSRTVSLNGHLTPLSIPVQEDMFSRSKSYTPLVPKFISGNCTECGICSEYCPVNIISPESGDFIDKKAKKKCTGCMACVNHCDYNARIIKPNLFMDFLVKWILKDASLHPKEPLTILP